MVVQTEREVRREAEPEGSRRGRKPIVGRFSWLQDEKAEVAEDWAMDAMALQCAFGVCSTAGVANELCRALKALEF